MGHKPHLNQRLPFFGHANLKRTPATVWVERGNQKKTKGPHHLKNQLVRGLGLRQVQGTGTPLQVSTESKAKNWLARHMKEISPKHWTHEMSGSLKFVDREVANAKAATCRSFGGVVRMIFQHVPKLSSFPSRFFPAMLRFNHLLHIDIYR